ncbi:uncharacterized protein LOC122041424 [Zingiber officinale]|uniref:uncharacterized protein LOC122041424 n=1 Tax=Zingiber officinale TaxID=94328 RepID=UPI001C4BB9DF|nr:uncharacterized protein LOC122041424 [Zingiber officinale]
MHTETVFGSRILKWRRRKDFRPSRKRRTEPAARGGGRSCVGGASVRTTLPTIRLPRAGFTLPSSSVAGTTTRRGTTSLVRMIHLMLPNSTTAAELRTQMQPAAPLISMFPTTMSEHSAYVKRNE